MTESENPIPAAAPGPRIYAGLFIITLATLFHELLLTRIFSITMWYHFAFVAISVAMFGMTVGAVIVYLQPLKYTVEKTREKMAFSSLLFSITIVFSFLTHLSIPFVTHKSLLGAFIIFLTYAVIAVPYVFSGICVTLALTRFPGHIAKLYAWDLAGAATGCIAMLVVLRYTSGPNAVMIVALLAAFAAFLFAVDAGNHILRKAAFGAAVLIGGFIFLEAPLVRIQKPMLRILWCRDRIEPIPLYEKWNPFARVRVDTEPLMPVKPFGWGMSRTFQTSATVEELSMRIDSGAGTVLTRYTGQSSETEHLKYDITNFAHHLRSDADVLVVGTGGGRDILAALAFDQKSVTGVELNRDIMVTSNKVFGDFTGRLDKHPKVRFIVDEARSYIAASKTKYDIIMVSLIDTFAATAAGAFVLTENSLYTVEAWKTFIDHLTPGGILTFSRWYFRARPAEMYRLTSIAVEAMKKTGVQNPQAHLVILRQMLNFHGKEIPDGVGTMLVSKEPFSEADLARIRETADLMQFEIMMMPGMVTDPAFAAVATGKGLAELKASLPYRINAPTDNSPFFFHMLRFRDILNKDAWEQGFMSFNMKAVFVLYALLITVVILTVICIIGPLIPTIRFLPKMGIVPLSLFFAGIGLGFMFIEISQMQRLIIFLGHPSYGLSVVLFSVLLSSGVGSLATQRIGAPRVRHLLIFMSLLVIFGAVTPSLVRALDAQGIVIRVIASVGVLIPLGFFMGMAFPIGMRRAQELCPALSPWLWGVNGAFSVCASVLSVIVALSAGISASYWTGVACYAVAAAALIRSYAAGEVKTLSTPETPVSEAL